MNPIRRGKVVAGIGGLAVIAVAAVIVVRWSPQVPADAASEPIARTVMTGAIAPDESGAGDGSDIPRSPYGQQCLPRINRDGGYLDVCWQAYRSPFDGDPQKDYYVLHVYGTFGPGTGGSPRWAVFKAHLAEQPQDDVLSTWPDGDYDGACTQAPVALGVSLDDGTTDMLCGRITTRDETGRTHVVTWTCEGCLLPSDRDRSLSLYEAVGVAEGTIPSWDIYADVGG